VTDQEVPRRVAASRVPEITGIRLAPIGGDATLINISSSGVLAECGTRMAPKMTVTVFFEGTFTPASVDGQVSRCVVAGIGKDGALRYHVGIAFNHTILFDAERTPAQHNPLSVNSPLLPVPVRPAVAQEVRNRW
jgi:hypothetical protein